MAGINLWSEAPFVLKNTSLWKFPTCDESRGNGTEPCVRPLGPSLTHTHQCGSIGTHRPSSLGPFCSRPHTSLHLQICHTYLSGQRFLYINHNTTQQQKTMILNTTEHPAACICQSSFMFCFSANMAHALQLIGRSPEYFILSQGLGRPHAPQTLPKSELCRRHLPGVTGTPHWPRTSFLQIGNYMLRLV